MSSEGRDGAEQVRGSARPPLFAVEDARRGRACALSHPVLCYCSWWASVGDCVGAWSRLGSTSGGGRCLGGSMRVRSLAQIFAIAVGGLRSWVRGASLVAVGSV